MRYTITRDNAERDLRALRGALRWFHPGVSSSIIPALQELADSIEEQVKPKVTEPTEWGSVVRARLASFEEEVFTAPFRWQRHGAVGGTWVSEPADDLGTRYYGDWSHLRNVEVLRVGIGDNDEWHRLDVANAQTEAYTKGAEDFAAKVRREICALRSKVVTGPEMRTCDDLLALVGILQGLAKRPDRR